MTHLSSVRQKNCRMNHESDPIIAEIRVAREAHAASFGHDMKRIVEDYQRLVRELGLKTVTLPPRKPADYRRPSAA